MSKNVFFFFVRTWILLAPDCTGQHVPTTDDLFLQLKKHKQIREGEEATNFSNFTHHLLNAWMLNRARCQLGSASSQLLGRLGPQMEKDGLPKHEDDGCFCSEVLMFVITGDLFTTFKLLQ